MTTAKRVVIAGGGTAGHVYPGLALADVLTAAGWDALFIGTPSGPESRLVPAAGFRLEPVTVISRAKGLSVRNLAASLRLATATARSLSVIAHFDPQVVVGTGGYASLPPILAGALHRVPIVIHEQNAVPGLANRVGSRLATLVAVSFPGTEERFSDRGRLTGNPVRAEISELKGAARSAAREEALSHFGLAHGRRTLLVMGGSQGAASINKAVIGAYHLWRREERIQLLHLVGPRNIEEVDKELSSARGPDDRIVWRTVGYTDRMDLALAAADLVLCRGGSTTIFELAASGLPGICIPYPYSIDDDQRRNGEAVAAKGGVEVVADGDLSSSLVTHKVENLIFDEVALDKMSSAIRTFHIEDAAQRLAALVEEAAKGRSSRKSAREPSVETSPPGPRDPKGGLDEILPQFPAFPWGRIHIVGIAGARNAPLAMVLKASGVEVTGSDREDSKTLVGLSELGIRAQVGHDASNIEGASFVVYSPAVAQINPELEAARAAGIPTMTGAEALGLIVADRRVVAVGGTNGKSTTTSMLVKILEQSGLDPSYVIGANLPNGTGTPGGKLGSGQLAIVEADEAYGSFLHLRPAVSIITSIDADHLDYYGDIANLESAFSKFISQTSEQIVVCADHERALAVLASTDSHPSALLYGIDRGDLIATSIDSTIDGSAFDLVHEGHNLGRVEIRVPGRHNVLNALAAAGAALAVGVDFEQIARGLATFTGISRRFEYRGSAGGADLFDDYAHNPAKVSSILAAARLGPWKRILAVFQPHLYSRTMSLWREFGSALSSADIVVVTDIYPAREDPIPGVTGKLVVEAACEEAPGKRVVYMPSLDQAAEFVRNNARPGDLVLSMGAGDITTLAEEVLKSERAERAGS